MSQKKSTSEHIGKNEPQSYGGNEEWLTGKTGQTVTDDSTSRADEGFYQSRHGADSASESDHARSSGDAGKDDTISAPDRSSDTSSRKPR